MVASKPPLLKLSHKVGIVQRRRGLFIRSNGQKINADVNGCLNIGRKELGDDWLKKLIETDEGCLMQPVAIRIG